MNVRKYSDIAYNFVVCPHGYTFEGRGRNIINAANGTNVGNRTSHAICFLAGVGNGFPPEEKAGFRATVQYIAEQTTAPDGCIGHRDHKATECPGNARYAWIHEGMPVPTTSTDGGMIVNGANRAQGGFALVGPDGGVFAEDGAPFYGSLPGAGVVPNVPIQSLAWALDGEGYWLVSEDGGVYAFGSAEFRGSYLSLPEEHRNDPTRKFVTIVARGDGGYSLISSSKERYDF